MANPAHDQSYKLLFGQPAMMTALLTGIIRGEWLASLDLTTLTPLPTEHISGKLDKRHNDLIWKVQRTDGSDLYLLIMLEHQSSNDTLMAVRLMTYRGLLYENLWRGGQIKTGTQLPNLLPVVLYSGEEKWTAHTDVAELLQAAPPGFKPWQPSHRYLLIDEARLATDPDLPQDNLATLLFRLAHNEGIEDAKQILQAIYDITGNQREVRRAFLAWTQYVLLPKALPDVKLPELNDFLEVRDMLTHNTRAWTEQWKQQGVQQGIEQGRQEGISDILAMQLQGKFGTLPSWVDERLRQADGLSLTRWATRLLDAHSLEQVFGKD